jgi:cobalamin biosynthesis protein CbiD
MSFFKEARKGNFKEQFSVQRTQSQILAKTLGKLGRKYQHQIYAAGTATIIVMQTMPSYGWGLFDSAQVAMKRVAGHP